MGKYETIRYEKKDAVAKIILNRPDVYNALNPVMNREITDALKTAERDQEIRCVVLTGDGKAFSAGQDIKSVEVDMDYGSFLRKNYYPMVNTFQSIPKPTVAAVNGVAAGAGMSLTLLTDFRIVKPEAQFVSAFLGIALVPDAGFMYILPRLVGYAKALEIATIGKPITGEEAVKLGLASELIDATEWDEGVENFTQKLASLPPKAFSLVKRYMMDSMHTPFERFLEQEAEAQRIAGLTEDHQEGVQAFLEKRRPKFEGK
ncbi:enoyl-CoA hydratase/isomerase family protein [Pseudogracilibacillus sp. SE30717A]|uniref:enoyl-CoA hydratase/isomerase family protein n=1 Tax=Pseudogracilibacillus sp. SE30717A TaxID=3098293 RepID=UPI00300E3B18